MLHAVCCVSLFLMHIWQYMSLLHESSSHSCIICMWFVCMLYIFQIQAQTNILASDMNYYACTQCIQSSKSEINRRRFIARMRFLLLALK
jgi:hypothetical protein